MSTRFRVAMGGVTELIGMRMIHEVMHRPQLRLVALTLGELDLPRGAQMEVFVADAERWTRVMRAMKPKVFIVGLGAPVNLAGRDNSPFQPMSEEAVIDLARAARYAGVERLIAISSAGADRWSRDNALAAKGKAEGELARLGFKRLDILQPGPLIARTLPGGEKKPRSVTEPLLRGNLNRHKAIDAQTVVEAIVTLSLRRTIGKFTHDNDGIERAADMLTRASSAHEAEPEDS